MDKNQSGKNIFKYLYSLVIVAIHTGTFYYVLFSVYNKMLSAPLDSGGYLMVVLYCAGIIGFFKTMGALKVGYNRQFNIILSHVISLCVLNVIAYLQMSLIHRAFLSLYPVFFMTVVQIVISVIWTVIVFKIKPKDTCCIHFWFWLMLAKTKSPSIYSYHRWYMFVYTFLKECNIYVSFMPLIFQTANSTICSDWYFCLEF